MRAFGRFMSAELSPVSEQLIFLFCRLNGLRVTAPPPWKSSIEMVLVGKVNKSLVSRINGAGGTPVGLSGYDGRLLTPRPAPDSAALGFVGDVASIDSSIPHPLLSSGHIPVVASVAADESGQAYNINADTVAGEIAATVGAEKLILLTDVPGILEDRNDLGTMVQEIDIKGVRKMVDDGKVAGGMIPKVMGGNPTRCCSSFSLVRALEP